MLKQLSDEQYWQLTGLLALGNSYIVMVNNIEKAVNTLLMIQLDKDDPSYHVTDAIFSGFTADELMDKLGLSPRQYRFRGKKVSPKKKASNKKSR